MKKLVFYIFAVMVGIVATEAQDTVDMFTPLDKYFCYPQWTHEIDYSFGDNRSGSGSYGVSPAGEFGWYCFSSKEVTIYGIAAALKSEKRSWVGVGGVEVDITRLFYDTTDQREYLRLYHPEGDSLRWIAQAPVQLGVTPIAFRANFDTVSPPRWVADMYEVYFDEPCVVSDSFYVGMTCLSVKGRYVAPDGHTYYQKYPSTLVHFLDLYLDTPRAEWCYFDHTSTNDGFENHWCYTCWTMDVYEYDLIFPILTPPDTTVGLHDEPFAARYVSVSPNPASDRVEVLSSFPFRHIEVYDMMGHTVLSDDSEGLRATVNVSALPSGMYLFQIHTTMGIVTKKLIVERTK